MSQIGNKTSFKLIKVIIFHFLLYLCVLTTYIISL
jgi:hypothetical protein